jgi:hypothetical protein
MKTRTIEYSVTKLALLAREVGFSLDDLTQMLNSGVTMEELLEIIGLKLTGRPLQWKSGTSRRLLGNLIFSA